MLEIIGSLLSSVAAGGATGILGAAVQRFADYKNRQLDIQAQESLQAHEIAKRKVDAEIVDKEWAGRIEVANVDASAKEAEADAKALADSYKLEPMQYSAGQKLTKNQAWVVVILDAIRGVVRPGLTVYLCVLTTLIYLETKTLGAAMSPDRAGDVYVLVIKTILYLTTTVVLWWFGTRNKGGVPK